MKKSNTLFTLAFFAILAFSSCEREQWGNAQKGPDDIDNRAEGQIGGQRIFPVGKLSFKCIV